MLAEVEIPIDQYLGDKAQAGSGQLCDTTPPAAWGLFCYSLAGTDMKQINLIKFYRLGMEIKPTLVTGEQTIESLIKLTGPAQWLRSFLVEIIGVPVPKTREAARILLDYIDNIKTRMYSNLQEKREVPIDTAANVKLRELFEAFELEFEHDCRDLNVFSVSDVGTHSTTKLLDRAVLNLSKDVIGRLKQVSVDDINAAGRCLAFNIPTAAGFHILRAVEPLILEYNNLITGRHLPVRSRSWGVYRRQLSDSGIADPRVIAMIDHIKDFYRNPIMHPEETLDIDQALSLFHTCLSAIVQLDAAIGDYVKIIMAGPSLSPP